MYFLIDLKKGQVKRQRATNLLNLGITNRKLDQQYRISVSGRVGLNLIQPSTNDRTITTDTLKNIGQLLMYVIDVCLPRTPFGKEFKVVTSYEKEYLDLFADQLLITDPQEKERFCIPAISFLINGDLNPHCDAMNPTTYEDDYTICLNVQISKDKLPSSILQDVKELYPYTIPFCLVMYKRKALYYYRNRMTRMHRYIYEMNSRVLGRQLLVDKITSVDTHLDYVGIFFDTKKRESLIDHFVIDKDKRNHILLKKAEFREAIDKLGYYSGLLHIMYLYLYRFGVDAEDCMSIILFFAHQCTTTSTLVTVLLQMITDSNNSYDTNSTLYNLLAQKCSSYDNITKYGNDNEPDTYLKEEFSGSNTLTSSEVVQYQTSMNLLFAKARSRMLLLKQNNKEEKLKLFNWVQKSLCISCPRLNSIDGNQASVIIQVSALIGMLPLDYYTNIPICCNRESLYFIEKYFGISNMTYWKDIQKQEYLIHLTQEEMLSLQDIFTNEYTANMNNNLISIISRDELRSDIFYFLPWMLPNGISLTEPKLQLMFRICGKRKDLWTLEAFDGISTTAFLSNDECTSVVTYNMTTNGLITKRGHNLDLEVLQSVFKTR